MKAPETLEPAERDPKAIRRTVIILIVLMLLGGFFIVYKYKEKMGYERAEMQKGRPSMSLGSVSSKANFGVKATDGKIYSFTLLEGKLSLMTVISAKLPKQSKLIIDEMKRAQEHFKDEDLQLVCISADKISDVSIEELKIFSEELGANGEHWKFLASDKDAFSGYVKNNLKLGVTSRVDKETGARLLPDYLRIVDPGMKIRGEIDDFKFIFYHDIEEKTKKDLESDPSLLENKEVKKNLERYQNAVILSRKRMYKNINYVLENENTNVVALKEANRSNKYKFPLIIFSGFIAFIIIMGYRLKKQRKKEAISNKK